MSRSSSAASIPTPPRAKRSATEFFTPPSTSSVLPTSSSASPSSKVSAAVSYFESRSRDGSPRSSPRKGVARSLSGEMEELADGPNGEGSPTPVKGSTGRRASDGNTPTRMVPRVSSGGVGSPSRIPMSSGSGSGKLTPRATPPPRDRTSPTKVGGASVPAPRSVSYGSAPTAAGPSRIPRPARRVSKSTQISADISPKSSASRTIPTTSSSSRIPIPSSRRPLRQPITASSSDVSLAEASPDRPLVDTPPTLRRASNSSLPRSPRSPGSRRTSYRLSASLSSTLSTSPTPESSPGHARKPSGSSVGSIGSPRRPSGHRKSNHTPRASVTSLSGSAIDETVGERGEGSSTSGRSSIISVSEEESERSTRPVSSVPPGRPSPTTPVRPMFIDIPRRTSSVSLNAISPISPGPQTARPMISPRRWGSSREIPHASVTAGGGVFMMGRASSSDNASILEVDAASVRLSLDAKRRASQAVQLGEVSPIRPNRDAPNMEAQKQLDDSDFMPGAFNGSRFNLAGRRSSQIILDTTPSSDSDNISSTATNQIRHTLPRHSPRLDRNMKTLSIHTSPSPSPTRPTSVFVPSQPSPPIPARNPLRLSRPGSAASTRPPDIPPRRVTSGAAGLTEAESRTSSVFLDSPAEVEETDEESPKGGMYTSRMGAGSMVPVQNEFGSAGGEAKSDENEEGRGAKRSSGDWGWGAKRRGRIMVSGEMEAAGLVVDNDNKSAKDLPDIPIPTPLSSTSSDTLDPDQPVPTSPPREPLTPDPKRHQTPTKSPSMPLLGHGSPPSKASRLLGLSPSTSTFAAAQAQMQMRSGTDPTLGQSRLLPPPMLRSPTTPNITPSLSSGIRPPSTTLSKRSHLIREIAMTERAYATDLALIRDAFISRSMQPPSTHSVDTAPSPGGGSGESGRTSMHASQSYDSRRASNYSTHSTLATVPPPISPLPKSPSGTAELGENAYFTSSSASLSPLPQVSPRTTSNPVPMGPPVGKPLSPADIRAIFLNIDQLAAAAEDLAGDFERAIGEEEPGPGSTIREGEGGTDRLGEIFLAHLSRLRPLFTFYCARQSTASTRLVEIQADQSHATYLKDRWDQIKPHTHAWNLDSMLIKPVQRITKYPLLFDDLLACTTPVHPDYFSIRSAAESCKTMALEIDEAKRRKDVVAGVISKKPSTGGGGGASGIMSKTPSKRGGGLKLFRNKGSSGASTVSLATTFSKNNLISPSTISLAPPLTSSSSATLIPPSPSDSLPSIPQASFAEYRQWVEKLEEADQMTRRVGREVVHYTAAAKEVFVTQMTMVMTWEKVVRLDGNDPGDKRLRAFRSVGEGLIEASWWELNAEVKDQIIPALSRLLDLVVNPRKVILKRDAKASDYARMIQQKDRNRSTDRTLLDSAREFVALHTQLMEELPAFLEGYIRIFDFTLLSFSRAQAKYHASVRDRLEGYSKRWIGLPKSPKSPRRNTVDLSDEPQAILPDTTTPIGIIQAWQTAWTPFSEAMDHFRITRTSRMLADRMASYSQRTGGQGHIRSNSGTNSPVRAGSPSRPDLRHTNSFTSNRSATLVDRSPTGSLRRPDGGNRSRSASLRIPSEGFTVKRTNTGGMDIPQHRNNDNNHLHPTLSRSDVSSVDRLSFGLPQISPTDDSQFAGLGLGFTPQTRAQNPGPGSLGSMASSIGLNGLGLGMSEGEGPGQVAVVPPTPPQSDTATMPYHAGVRERPRSGVMADDAGEGWRGERVLYQCGAVADFDPKTVGTRRYRKLRFLPVITGDIIDVFYEVGRIDELPAFPYPELGVENDGLLVGRKEDGDIGLVICSFLEPLT